MPASRRLPQLQAQPATTANNGKTTITCRTPALYFTNRVTQKTARTAAAGATVVHRRGRERSTQSPTRQSKRKGSGVFTATATRKKYHHPPFFSFPSRYASEGVLFSAQALARPFSKAGAGSQESLSTRVRAILRAGPGKCWKDGIDSGESCILSLTCPAEKP